MCFKPLIFEFTFNKHKHFTRKIPQKTRRLRYAGLVWRPNTLPRVTHFSLPVSVCADWNVITPSHSWLFLFYFKCSYRLKSEWQRNIPQSVSLLIAQTFLHFLFQTLLATPTHTDSTANQSEGQSARGPIRAQEAGFRRGVREICFVRCCTINTNTHSLTLSTTAERKTSRIWHGSGSNEETWPSVT